MSTPMLEVGRRHPLSSCGIRPEFLQVDAQSGDADVDQTLKLAFRVGPLGSALREHAQLQGKVAGAVKDVLTDIATPHGVLMQAAVRIALDHNEKLI